MSAQNALYAQSGGVTATINASACGVIETARRHRGKIGRVYAARNGILGALAEDLIDTSAESTTAIRALMHTPGGAFGSCRFDLSPMPQGRSQYERLIQVFRAHNIGHFFYNGGNGSAETAHLIATELPRLGWPVTAIAIPKTIDNDIVHSDCSPGFGSVAKFVATSMREAMADLASMSHSSTKVFVMEVMGRYTGWIAAACGLAQPADKDGPLLLLVPEIHFDRRRFLAAVRLRIARYGWCAVAVAEGLKLRNGRRLTQAGGDGIPGHEQLGGVAPLIAAMVRDSLKVKVHWSALDYVQRAARHLASKTDVAQAYAVGRAAVGYALQGRSDVMPVIERISDRPYRWRVTPAPLAGIMNREKRLPRRFLTADGWRLTAHARGYFTPLIRGEAWPPFADGLPVHASLKLRRVRPKLKSTFRENP
ncbi:MAG: 6-phosphofructokinase [Betaproteobacteria bacterium]|nr:6-phosphofructokinase [Betaproteobacteria bacterium]